MDEQKNDLISVVIPVYNVESFLNRCVESIIGQTYTNLEIILVDDGSPDHCPQMCDEWAAKDSRIRVIHKKNAGLGMARNSGIDAATGEYICFFDSDDYVALDTIEKAYVLASSEKSDIVQFGFVKMSAAGTVLQTIIPNADKVTYSDEEVRTLFLPARTDAKLGGPDRNSWLSACTCLYSMSMILKSGWRFASEREIISEDVYSLLCLYQYVRRVSVLPEALYFYCENSASLTHVYRSDRFEKVCYFHEVCTQKVRELGYGEGVEKRLQRALISYTITAMKQIVCADLTEKEKYDAIREIVRSDYLRNIRWDYSLHSDSLPRRIFLFLFAKRLTLPCYLLLKIWQK